MKIIVKTLKGEKFSIDVEASATVETIKQIIETTKADMPASSMKLIHSGKVLKDSDSVETCGIKENDFLVVMVTKPKKVAAPRPHLLHQPRTRPRSSTSTSYSRRFRSCCRSQSATC
ncbi:XPC-binding domain [Fragilaria crotonensis]|nr:XPC-binding domain [Fragilaria crotonensis]